MISIWDRQVITEQFADEGLHFERFEVVDVLASADEDDGTARRSNATTHNTRTIQPGLYPNKTYSVMIATVWKMLPLVRHVSYYHYNGLL